MSKRLQARRANGRFQRNTLSNTFGLKAYICTDCRAINTVAVGQSKPNACHKCGGKEFEL